VGEEEAGVLGGGERQHLHRLQERGHVGPGGHTHVEAVEEGLCWFGLV
jgi:hypothetical protein